MEVFLVSLSGTIAWRRMFRVVEQEHTRNEALGHLEHRRDFRRHETHTHYSLDFESNP